MKGWLNYGAFEIVGKYFPNLSTPPYNNENYRTDEKLRTYNTYLTPKGGLGKTIYFKLRGLVQIYIFGLGDILGNFNI